MNGQTSVIGTHSVDIRTEKNTDVEGAVIAAGKGSLKLDTDTLTYKDILDHDTGSSTQVGVSVPLGSGFGSSTPAASSTKSLSDNAAKTETKASTSPAAGKNASAPVAPSTQEGVGSATAKPANASSSSWMDYLLNGPVADVSYDSYNRQQVNRATIGEGTIIIRSDPSLSLEGLNRNLALAQEVTDASHLSYDAYVNPPILKLLFNTIAERMKDKNYLKEIDRKSAHGIMELTSGEYDNKSKVGDYNKLSDEYLRSRGIDPAKLDDKATGFEVSVYKNDVDHTITAIQRGSTFSWGSWKNNFFQALGFGADQYEEAAANGDLWTNLRNLAKTQQSADGTTTPYQFILAGHSEGGGKNDLVANLDFNDDVKMFDKVYLINSANLHENTLHVSGQSFDDTSRVVSYVSPWDVLTLAQDLFGIGMRHTNRVYVSGGGLHFINSMSDATLPPKPKETTHAQK